MAAKRLNRLAGKSVLLVGWQHLPANELARKIAWNIEHLLLQEGLAAAVCWPIAAPDWLANRGLRLADQSKSPLAGQALGGFAGKPADLLDGNLLANRCMGCLNDRSARANDLNAAQRSSTLFNDSSTVVSADSTQDQRPLNDRLVRVFCMTYLSERIKAIAPGNAAYFRLKMQLHDGNVRIFPADEGGYFKINESPYGVPSGPYLLCFYDEDLRPLIHRAQTFVINAHQDAPRSGQQQLALNFQGTGGSAASSSSAGSAPAVTPAAAAPTPAAAPIAAAQMDETAPLTESDLEMRRHQYAMELEDRQQEFLKNSTYATEVAEIFMLNRVMRREMMEMQRNMVLHSQTAYRDFAQIKATIHGLMELQNSVIAHVEKHQKHPPPPPPDYVGLGHSAIELMKDVGVALIQRWPSPHAAQAASQPQLPAPPAAQTQAAAPSSSSPDAPPADALDRMTKRFRGLSELELARALSSPESWKELLESFRKEAASPSQAPATAPDSADGLEG